MGMSLNIGLFMPVKLFYGNGCLLREAASFAQLGRRCLIVCTPSAAKACGALEDATAALDARGISCRLFDEVPPNPTVDCCLRAGRMARACSAEFILGIGGGSAMDAAKAISVFAANEALDEDGFYQKHWISTPLKLALVGTTAGTGSEVTMVSVLTDRSGRKHSIHDERLYAALAFSDPRYLTAMPHAISLSTGIDALSHCVESYFSKKATPFSKTYAA